MKKMIENIGKLARDLAKKIGEALKKIDLKKLKKFKPPKDFKFKLNRKNLLIILIAIVLLVVIIKTTANIHNALFKGKAESLAKKEPGAAVEEEAPPVKVFKIKKMDFKDTLPVMGNIKGFKEIDLKFQTQGIIESFNFEEGEKIQEGDIIASLVQRDQLLKLKYAETEMNKNQKLFDIGAINAFKLDQVKLEYESAKSDLDKTNIYATSNGLLGTKLVDAGSFVTPNDKVGTFVAIDKVYAEFNIIEKDVPKVALGQKVEVFVDSYPNKSFSGTIDRISPVVEGRSRTQNVKAEIDNKEGLLKPGMFTRALIATYEKKDVIVIPSSALKKKDADYFVYVIHKEEPKEAAEEKPKEKRAGLFGLFGAKKKKIEEAKPEAEKEKAPEFGTVEIRKVDLGYITQDMVEIAKGLQEDELIIVEIQEELKDKAKVEIAEVQEGLL